MKNIINIAIQHTVGSYSDRWIDYCKQNNYNYKLVDCYKSDIFKQLDGCTHFLWHFKHSRLKDMLFAKQLLYSISNMGIKVFPNYNTVWHFDDKIGQKYLLESIGAPLVNSYVFYDKISALEGVNKASYPFVFKLRGGAGSSNVKLIKSKAQALKVINVAFSKGFYSKPPAHRMKENWIKFKRNKSFSYIRETLGGLKNYLFQTHQQKLDNKIEKGYLYFQEFLPTNDFDIRIVVIGNRANASKRVVRENDFRASGSGLSLYSKDEIDERCVKIAFEISKKLNSQSVAFDFIFGKNNEPKIVEISYATPTKVHDPCEGYWDNNLKWYSGHFISEYWIIEDLLRLK